LLYVIGTEINGKGVRFHLSEFRTYFESKIGDVMLIKVILIQYATKIRDSVDQLDMCVYMQASFFFIWAG
jgi:hypothetical protein